MELGWLASAGVTSDYVHRGLTQSSGKPAVQGGLSLRVPQGLYTGVWASTIDTSRQSPDFGDGEGFEINALVGIGRPLGAEWSWNLNAGRYLYTGLNSVLDYDYTEVQAALGWRERLRLSLAYSPDSTDHRRNNQPLTGARYVADLALEWPLTRWLAATAGLGYQDAQQVSEVRFLYTGIGLNLRWRGAALGIARYGTDGTARGRWADGRADDRVVVNLAATWGGETTFWR
jgi:uncharacterized protein (TIGR02001 family)